MTPKAAIKNSLATYFYSPLSTKAMENHLPEGSAALVMPSHQERSRIFMTEQLNPKQAAALEESWANVLYGGGNAPSP
ncbi:MAG: hypothetical protein CMI09_05945 [Oceanospirillaceae bacterium]|nr:hypothetical protein [Oceanospirillaceae bacterium]